MDTKSYFQKYVSNTASAGGNQSHFLSDPQKSLTGRAFYRVHAGGDFKYSFLYSNVTDSTFSDGSFSRPDMVLGSFSIEKLRVAVVDTCDPDAVPDSAFSDVTFGGKASYTCSQDAELFYSDPVRLITKPDRYFCIEVTVKGEKLPCHPESLLPLFRKSEDGKWTESFEFPLPAMIGSDRRVELRVGFFGDSITQGIGVPKNSYKNYAALLAKEFGDRYSFWNLGLGYARAYDGAADGVWLNKAKNVDLCTVCLGVNDFNSGSSADDVIARLTTIVDKLKEAGVRIILQTVPPFDYNPKTTAEWLRTNDYIRNELSKKVEAVFDVMPVLCADPENAPQKPKFGGHPEETGNALWAAALRPVMQCQLEAMIFRNPIPASVAAHIEKTAAKLSAHPRLAQLYRKCYPNAIQTAAERLEDGSVFLYTGDIPAMWPRDSVEELLPYVTLAAEDAEVRKLLFGGIRRMLFLIKEDSYANSFNKTPAGHHYAGRDLPAAGDWVWERKYEIDTLCYPLWLIYRYWKVSGDLSVFEGDYKEVVEKIVDQWILEQHHGERSSYYHTRTNTAWHDTLQNGGKGYPVKYTGMTWQGFRPSDDATRFGYTISSNMFAVVILRELAEIAGSVPDLFPDTLVKKAARLCEEITHGIADFGVVLHPEFGWMYAYETDGFGNYLLCDDANMPNLLSAPFLGFCPPDDPIYRNTRRFVLSRNNPYYFEGKYAHGVGSPHTPAGYVWHMGLIIEALTEASPERVREILYELETTDGGTGFFHEGFDVSDPNRFTRAWFSATNSLFAELIESCLRKGIL